MAEVKYYTEAELQQPDQALSEGKVRYYSEDELQSDHDWGESSKGMELYMKSALKGAGSFIGAIPGMIGNRMIDMGEQGGAGVVTPYFQDGVEIVNSMRKETKKSRDLLGPVTEPVDEAFVKAGRYLSEKGVEFLNRMDFQRPEKDKIAQLAFDLGSGGASIAASLGLLYTLGPAAPAVFFGETQKASVYEEARTSGKTPDEASALSTAAGLWEGGVEGIGGNYWLKSISYNNRLLRTLVKAGIEGLEEGLQQSGEEAITQLSGVRQSDLLPTLGRIGYSAALGIILGAPAGAITSVLEKSKIKQDLKALGLKDEQANAVIKNVTEKTLESGEVKAEVLMHLENEVDKANKIMNESLPQSEEEGPSQEDLAGLEEEYTKSKGHIVFDKNGREWVEREGKIYSVSATNAIDGEGKFKGYKLGLRPYAVHPERVAQVKKNLIEHGKPSPLVSKPTTIEQFEAKIAEIDDKKERADIAKDAKQGFAHILDIVKKRVKTPKKGEAEFEEGQRVPKRFKNKNGLSLDEARDELEGVGKVFESTSDMIDYLETLDSQMDRLDEVIAEGKAKKSTKTEKTTLKQRIKDVQRGIREGSISTKKEIKDIQASFKKLLKDAGLPPADWKKFSAPMSAKQFEKSLPELLNRIDKLQETAYKERLQSKITKALKTTKPTKQGQRRVGKYDYESNKYFEQYLKYSKMTKEKAAAELDSMAEGGYISDLMKQRMLSLRANGKAASAELYLQVFTDIKRMQEIGAQAKTEQDFDKALDRQMNVDKTLEALGKSKADAKSWRTMFVNAYRRGFTNQWSMFNAVLGKELADLFNQELNENKRTTAVYQRTLEMTMEALRIYGEKNISTVMENLQNQKYETVDHRGIKKEISKWELLDIYNSIKNDAVAQRYDDTFGAANIQSLMGELTVQDTRFADYLQQEVQSYKDVLNQRHIETTGRDMGFVENYWPATSEHKDNIFDDVRIQGETPSALKERARGKVIPKPGNAWHKAQKHIAQAEHIDKLSRSHEMLKRIFTDAHVEDAIEKKYGKNVLPVIMAQIKNISLNTQKEKLDMVSDLFRTGINNWVTAKVALNPSTFVRQLGSVGNYAEEMSAVEWTKLFFEGIMHPKETFDYMWENNPFLEARFNRGYSEALVDAIEGAQGLGKHRGNWAKFLSSFARTGDMIAIIYGGYPVMKTKGSISFESATLRAQQSGLSTSLSEFQNSKSPFARLFLAFKNTANQYFRKMADAFISYGNGDISFKQLSKTLTIYGVIQPIIYATSGIAVKQAMKGLGGNADDPEEIAKDVFDSIIIQMVVSPVNALPILSDFVVAFTRHLLGKKVYKMTTTPLLDDLETFKKLFSAEVTAKDWMEVGATLLEPASGAPAKLGIRIFDYITGENKNKYLL